jgi:ribulose-phosphate 3-epimerase
MRRQVYASVLELDPAGIHAALDTLVAAGVDGFHLDVADGRFIPRTVGTPALARALAATGLPFEVHLMTADPAKDATRYAAAGARVVYAHAEVGERRLEQAFDAIERGGAEIGLALRLETGLDAVAPYLDHVTALLLLGVPAGRGGQPMGAVAPARLTEAARRYPALRRCADGGVTAATAPALDAPLLVAGRALDVADPAAVLDAIRGA